MSHSTLGPRREYVRAVLDLYVRLPGTRLVPSRQDRRLAATLYQRGIPFSLVRTALLLAAARRTLRSQDAPPLPPVGCLHYFLPVIDELTETPAEPSYVDYLAGKIDPLMKPASDPVPTPGQKTSLPAGR